MDFNWNKAIFMVWDLKWEDCMHRGIGTNPATISTFCMKI